MKNFILLLGFFCVTLFSLERPPKKLTRMDQNQKKQLRASDRVYSRPPQKKSAHVQVVPQYENNCEVQIEAEHEFEAKVGYNPGFQLTLTERVREKLTEDDGLVDRMSACTVM